MSVALKPPPFTPTLDLSAGGMVPAPTLIPWPTPRRLRATLKDVAESTSGLAALPVFAPLAMLAVALLAWRGIHARLREYEL